MATAVAERRPRSPCYWHFTLRGIKVEHGGRERGNRFQPDLFLVVESERTRARGRSLFYQKKKEKGSFSQASFCSQPGGASAELNRLRAFHSPSLLPAIALKLFDIFPNDGQTVCVVCLSGCRVDCRVDTTICKKGHTRAHAPRCKLGRFTSRSQAQCGSLFFAIFISGARSATGDQGITLRAPM